MSLVRLGSSCRGCRCGLVSRAGNLPGVDFAGVGGGSGGIGGEYVVATPLNEHPDSGLVFGDGGIRL